MFEIYLGCLSSVHQWKHCKHIGLHYYIYNSWTCTWESVQPIICKKFNAHSPAACS